MFIDCSAAVVSLAFTLMLQSAPLSVPPASSVSEETLMRLRIGMSSSKGRQLQVAMPAQLTLDDLDYWAWLLALDAETEHCLRSGWGTYCAADDIVRAERFIPIFELAGEVSRPPQDLDERSAKELARKIASQRARAIAAMRAQEHASFERILTECEHGATEPAVNDPPELTEDQAVLLADLDSLRLQDLDRRVSDTSLAARVDLGRLVHSLGSGSIAAESKEIARVILLEAQPTLTELRRAHATAFNKRIQAGSILMLVVVNLMPAGAVISPSDAKGYERDRLSTRRQVASAARRITEANDAILESVCVSIPADDAKRLRRAYLDLACGVFAANPWDIADSAHAMLAELQGEDAVLLAELIEQYAEQSNATQHEIQRIADRYSQFTLEQSRPDREKWQGASKQIALHHAAQRAHLEPLLGAFFQGLPTERVAAWEPSVAAFRRDALTRADAQLEAIEPSFADGANAKHRPPPPPPTEANEDHEAAKESS